MARGAAFRADGQRDRAFEPGRLCAGLHIAAGVRLQVTNRHRLVALHRQPGHPLANRNQLHPFEHGRRDIGRGRLQMKRCIARIQKMDGSAVRLEFLNDGRECSVEIHVDIHY